VGRILAGVRARGAALGHIRLEFEDYIQVVEGLDYNDDRQYRRVVVVVVGQRQNIKVDSTSDKALSNEAEDTIDFGKSGEVTRERAHLD
jgi:glutamate formiminotransferase